MEYKNEMTDAMLAVAGDFKEDMEFECLYSVKKLSEANKAANVKLPSTNERGVLAAKRARQETITVAQYWYDRMMLASRHVSREFLTKWGIGDRYITELVFTNEEYKEWLKVRMTLLYE